MKELKSTGGPHSCHCTPGSKIWQLHKNFLENEKKKRENAKGRKVSNHNLYTSNLHDRVS